MRMNGLLFRNIIIGRISLVTKFTPSNVSTKCCIRPTSKPLTIKSLRPRVINVQRSHARTFALIKYVLFLIQFYALVFQVTGVAGRTLAIGMEGERAKPLDQPPALPTVHLTMDVQTFACLGCGRWEPRHVLASGKVRIEGDRALAETIVTQMNFMP